ncbi:hypothetical protein AAJ76_2300041850 [Vairimorpha ceranae]|uniref:Uncharacterized protein n=1 Tax=Vairimorpha ceranae TaxID=40302 RepID=A0A0F9WD68_9MICR|nr:hypothetical protein AAJ76_2300041850 [Vairimorpha ceranae]KAF5140006.1 hypothetical protein G9O61_00g017310 [Vairimorpha ceranae]KKO75381.1 hypothetical protein AAJ76_2300041850 [Vairimorpha ceranae]
MSRFFSDLEEEKKEIKKKFNVIEKQTEKISKKDKLQIEFDNRVNELFKNPKNVKKFVSDLKKYENVNVSESAEKILFNEKIYQKSNKVLIDKFLKRTIEDTIVKEDRSNNKIEVKRQNEGEVYEGILNISDKNERVLQLNNFCKVVEDINLKVNVLINLLSIYAKDKDLENTYIILSDLLNFYDNKKTKLFLDNSVDMYLDLFKEDVSIYKNILQRMKNINTNVYERRLLDLDFSDLKYTDSKYLDFKLIWLVKNNKFEESKIVLENIDFTVKHDNIFYKNLEEFANLMFINKAYLEAYTCFEYLYTKREQTEEIKKNFYILCVLLNKRIQETAFFQEFLTDFKSFGSNTFALKSKGVYFEIFRSFYLLHNYDVEGVYNILHEIKNIFDDREIIENCALELLA